MGVAIGPNVRVANEAIYVDFATGEKLTNYVPPAAADRTDALRRYLAIAESYLPIMEPGWWTFPTPKDIPADLLLPFGQFVQKHNLTHGLTQIFTTTGFGKHDMLGERTLWIMRSFNVDMVRTLLGINNGFVPASRNNQELFDKILARLGSDVLLTSTVTRATRSADKGITLEVLNHSTNVTTRIVAKKLLYTIGLTEENTQPFDFDASERSVVSQFKYSASFVGVVSHPSLKPNTSLQNVRSAAVPDNYMSALPAYPFNTRFDNYANSSYFRVIAVGDHTLTLPQARQVIQGSFDKMVEKGVVQLQEGQGKELTFHLLEPHGLVSAHADVKDLKKGFVQKLNALQGRREMWYTGAAWGVHISTSLWIFTDTVLERVVKSLRE